MVLRLITQQSILVSTLLSCLLLMPTIFCSHKKNKFINPQTKRPLIHPSYPVMVQASYPDPAIIDPSHPDPTLTNPWYSDFAIINPLAKTHPSCPAMVQTYFSPEDDITQMICDTFRGAEKSIYVTIYVITKKEIVAALIAAKERGVKVYVITDILSAEKFPKKLKELLDNGINVYTFNPYHPETYKKKARNFGFSRAGLMHQKYYGVDDKYVIAGSANATIKAEARNIEVMHKITYPTMATMHDSTYLECYHKKFQSLLRSCYSRKNLLKILKRHLRKKKKIIPLWQYNYRFRRKL